MTAFCGVAEGFPEACRRLAPYVAEWKNGDRVTLCVEHAEWVRGNSSDLVRLYTPERLV